MQSSQHLGDAITTKLLSLSALIPPRTGPGRWTKEIKRALADLGASFGCTTCAGGMPDVCEPEWLYDIVWFQNHPSGRLAAIELVAESEWSDVWSDIKYDFEKLLLAHCSLKLMIFQVADSMRPATFDKLTDSIRTYHTKDSGYTYILACFSDDEYNFVFHTVVA